MVPYFNHSSDSIPKYFTLFFSRHSYFNILYSLSHSTIVFPFRGIQVIELAEKETKGIDNSLEHMISKFTWIHLIQQSLYLP